MRTDLPNPYRIIGLQGQPLGWKWRDMHGRPSPRTYQTEQQALHDLLHYTAQRLPWWKRLMRRVLRRQGHPLTRRRRPF